MRRSKKMFSRLTNFVNNAVEALAPEMTHLEQFRYHWKAVTQFFLDTSDERMSVENTSIPYHIEQMLAVLLLEERENGTTSHGPSMEFMLQHKILETMQTLGRADCPPGMKRQVLGFFTNLLGKSKQQLLPHVNAHKPVNKLIRCCGEVKAAPTEAEEVAFLLQVSSKLKMDSYLVNFFLEKPSNSELGSTSPLILGMEREREKPEYSLVDSLLALTKSEDSRVAIKACEGLLLVTSIPEDNAASVIVLYTAFCERMADQLAKLFRSLPAVIDPFEMNQLSATWGFDHSDENMSTFTGKRQMIAFFSWLDYVNQLSVEAHPMVSKALAFGIRERFILTAIEPGLSQASEPCSITVTALLTRCLKLVTSPLLAQEFAAILLGTEEEEEQDDSDENPPERKKKNSHKIRDLLIHRINHISDQMAVETLRLFQALLQLPYQPIIDVLVTCNFKIPNFIDLKKARLIEEMSELSIKSNLILTIERETAEEDNDNELENEVDSGLEESEHNISFAKEIDEEMKGIDDTKIHDGLQGDNTRKNEKEREHCNSESSHDSKETLLLDGSDGSLNVPFGINKDDFTSQECSAGESSASPTQSLILERAAEVNEICDGEDKCEPGQASIKEQQQLELKTLAEVSMISSINSTEENHTVCRGLNSTKTFSKKRVEKVVNGFLLIFPEVLRTSDMAGDVGYDSYLRDAHKQCDERALQSMKYNWPCPTSVSAVSIANDPFYEGEFLQSIMKRLSMVLDQPFHINLEVTAIISLLCQFQHPFLHKFLMDTAGVVNEQYLTPHKILTKLCQEMKVRASRIPSCQALLLSMRKNLNATISGDLNSIAEEAFFQAVIILEEFCKELAAIAFVMATQQENSP